MIVMVLLFFMDVSSLFLFILNFFLLVIRVQTAFSFVRATVNHITFTLF